MSEPSKNDGNVKDSANESSQDENVEDSSNAQPKEAIASSKPHADQDAAKTAPLLPSSLPRSPPPSAPPSPRQARLMRVCTSAAPTAPPPRPIPFEPFMMPAGLVPPFYNHPMMMPPPLHFQFAPSGQHFVPYGYGYAMIPPNPWTTGPFDCFSDAKNCCLTCCCPCVTFGQIAEILNEGQTPWWEHAVIYLVMDTITFSIGTFLCAWPYRVKMRTKYWLRGKLVWDFIFTFLCTKVSLCQQYRQLGLLGFDVALGWEANREKMRIKQLQNMFQMQNRQVTPPTVEPGMYR